VKPQDTAAWKKWNRKFTPGPLYRLTQVQFGVEIEITTANKLFLGWFDPRGLASIVFASIVVHKNLPTATLIYSVVSCTVIMSLIAHGMPASLLAVE
jgi:NhaP-type Na+/H+ or K+/H+ antiporter